MDVQNVKEPKYLSLPIDRRSLTWKKHVDIIEESLSCHSYATYLEELVYKHSKPHFDIAPQFRGAAVQRM